MIRRRSGFTLVEMLTVIGVLVILLAIAVIGISNILRKAEGDQTKISLRTLNSMLTEYQNNGGSMALIDNIVPPNTSVAAPTDLVSEGGPSRDDAAVVNTRRILEILLRDPKAKGIYDGFPEKRKHKDGNGPIILDGWSNPIIYCPRGGLSGLGLLNRAKPGTGTPSFALTNQVKHSPEWRSVSGTNTTGRPFFASAGSDKRFNWGDDNLYSCD